MKRTDCNGTVHFLADEHATVCGLNSGMDLFGNPRTLGTTTAPVNCPACARIYCQIKNAPWNEVEEKTMDAAIYAAEGAEADTEADT